MATHEHRWRFTAHGDGCHFYYTAAICPCGASMVQTAERDRSDDPYGTVWFSDECARCRELAAGAKPKPMTTEVVGPPA